MTNINVSSGKLAIVFRPGELPRIDPSDPRIVINLGGVKIVSRVTPKAARKLGIHPGGAVLQGRLVAEQGQLVLLDAGFQFLDPKPVDAVLQQPQETD